MLQSLFGLSGRVVLVTGASSGIGRHLAQVAARAGARVAVSARRAQIVQEVADKIVAEGGEALPVELDVCSDSQIESALSAVRNQWGDVDLLVNNAGVAQTKGSLETSREDWRNVLATNLESPFQLSRCVVRRLIDAKRPGTIINVASIFGVGAASRIAPYCASKAGLINLTRSLAAEWARHEIRVNAMAPGYLVTDLNRDTLSSEFGSELRNRIPMRRFGRFEDLDGPFLLLASSASSFMTGSVLVVDGGQTAVV